MHCFLRRPLAQSWITKVASPSFAAAIEIASRSNVTFERVRANTFQSKNHLISLHALPTVGGDHKRLCIVFSLHLEREVG